MSINSVNMNSTPMGGVKRIPTQVMTWCILDCLNVDGLVNICLTDKDLNHCVTTSEPLLRKIKEAEEEALKKKKEAEVDVRNRGNPYHRMLVRRSESEGDDRWWKSYKCE